MPWRLIHTTPLYSGHGKTNRPREAVDKDKVAADTTGTEAAAAGIGLPQCQASDLQQWLDNANTAVTHPLPPAADDHGRRRPSPILARVILLQPFSFTSNSSSRQTAAVTLI